MSKTLDFKVFCFEAYKAEKKLTGKETLEMFQKHGVFAYLNNGYDVLHTQGRAFLVSDIDDYIKNREQKATR